MSPSIKETIYVRIHVYTNGCHNKDKADLSSFSMWPVSLQEDYILNHQVLLYFFCQRNTENSFQNNFLGNP